MANALFYCPNRELPRAREVAGQLGCRVFWRESGSYHVGEFDAPTESERTARALARSENMPYPPIKFKVYAWAVSAALPKIVAGWRDSFGVEVEVLGNEYAEEEKRTAQRQSVPEVITIPAPIDDDGTDGKTIVERLDDPDFAQMTVKEIVAFFESKDIDYDMKGCRLKSDRVKRAEATWRAHVEGKR